MGQYRLGEWSLRKERRGCDKGTGASLPHAKDRDMHTPPLAKEAEKQSYAKLLLPHHNSTGKTRPRHKRGKTQGAQPLSSMLTEKDTASDTLKCNMPPTRWLKSSSHGIGRDFARPPGKKALLP